MKKFIVILIIFALLIGGFFTYKFITNKIEEKRIAKIKEGWYVEVLIDELNIRKKADKNTSKLSLAKKGDVFAVDDYKVNGENFWYHIEYDDGKYGWIANIKDSSYLKVYNSPEDIMKPVIKFFEPTYYVDTINDIDYEHLEVRDDREGVVVTHKVYHEVDEENGIDQYWILYTATDVVGKSSSKVQKIEFNVRPDESQVEDFNKLER